MYQELKKHGRKILTGVLVVGAGFILNGCRKEIYNGMIKGNQIIYEENISNIFSQGDWVRNEMTISNGDTTLIFRDSYMDKSGIDWKNQNKPDFENDELEEVVIKTPTETKEYSVFNINSENFENLETMDTEHGKIIFDRANEIYNNFRKQIRKNLRSQHKTKLKSLENALN